jgi:tetratricopeptide (TPR) repeat protein
MKKGERAMLRCRADYAYGKNGQGTIPANATLNFDCELIKFEPKKKEKWEYTPEEKEGEATRLKEEGTGLFKEKRWQEAVDHYEEAAGLLDDAENGSAASIWVACKLNAAQCYINMNDYPTAAMCAGAALGKDGDNVKALYRRGLSRVKMGLAEEALVDLNKALALDPENAPVKTEIAKAKKVIQGRSLPNEVSCANGEFLCAGYCRC